MSNRGRPTLRNDDVIDCIIDGLSRGTPLAVICRKDGMPATRTVREWAQNDPELSAAIASAREDGWDVLAGEALDIADDGSLDTIETAKGDLIMDKEWVARSKLRVDTRLKLLAKWDPKRYGERLALAGDDGAPLNISVNMDDASL